jgi:hypothetical protein
MSHFIFTLAKFNKNLRRSRDGTTKHAQTIIDVTQKEAAVNETQHSCEMFICESHQTILRFLSTAATASTWWRVRELRILRGMNTIHLQMVGSLWQTFTNLLVILKNVETACLPHL